MESVSARGSTLRQPRCYLGRLLGWNLRRCSQHDYDRANSAGWFNWGRADYLQFWDRQRFLYFVLPCRKCPVDAWRLLRLDCDHQIGDEQRLYRVPPIAFTLNGDGYGTGDECNGSTSIQSLGNPRRLSLGDGEFERLWGFCKVTANPTNGGIVLYAQVSNTQSLVVYAPTLIHIAAGTLSANEVAQLASALLPYSNTCTAGQLCTPSGVVAGSGAFSGLTANIVPTGSGSVPYLQNSSPQLDNGATTANTLTYAGSGGITALNLTDSALTSGKCVQTSTGGLLAATASPCQPSGLTTGVITQAGSATTLVNSNPQLDNGVTTANTLTYAGSGGVTAPKVTDSGLTSGNCVQAGTGGLLGTVGGPCSTGGTVTNVGTVAPLSGTVTTTGNLSCPTCVTASSPGAGIAHFAGSTQAVTSSAVNLASSDVTGITPVANGGTGTSSPALVAGTNVTITGSWPNQTINSSGGGGGSVGPGTTNGIAYFNASTTVTSPTPPIGERTICLGLQRNGRSVGPSDCHAGWLDGRDDCRRQHFLHHRHR